MDLKAQAKVMERERNKPENKYWADCDTLGPQWISIKYGEQLCFKHFNIQS